MPEETDPTTEPTTEPTTTPPAGEGNLDDLPEWARKAITKANSEAARYRTERNEERAFREGIEALAAEAAEAEKTELQRAIERGDQAEAKFTEIISWLEDQKVRQEIADEKGLTTAQAARLQGSTREELEADADALIETFGISAGESDEEEPKPGHGLTPKVRPRSIDPTFVVEEKDPKKLADAVFATRRF